MDELPDSILESCILPLLPMRDAVETSLISRRWRRLSRHSILTRRNLEFDIANVFGNRPRDDMEKFVSDYLELYQGENVYSLKVKHVFVLDPESTRILDHWVRFAIAKGVEEMQLLLYWSFGHSYNPRNDIYVFPYQLLLQGSSLKHLSLHGCVLRPPPDFDGFNKLRSLRLSEVRVDQIFMAHLLSVCLLLESLTVKDCRGPSHLNIAGDHLSDLKLLQLSDCEKIEISAPNLVSLEYVGNFLRIVFVKTPPRLARIYFVTTVKYKDTLPSALTQITSFPLPETLLLWMYDEIPQMISSLPTFKNLKQLSLIFWQWGSISDNLNPLRYVPDLLKVAPLLEEFVLTEFTFRLPDKMNQLEIRNLECSRSFTHDHLKKVKLQGFHGNWCEIEFALWILRNAAKLEILVINPAGQFYDVYLKKWWDVRDKWYVCSSSWREDRILVQEKLEQVKTNARLIIES